MRKQILLISLLLLLSGCSKKAEAGISKTTCRGTLMDTFIETTMDSENQRISTQSIQLHTDYRTLGYNKQQLFLIKGFSIVLEIFAFDRREESVLILLFFSRLCYQRLNG